MAFDTYMQFMDPDGTYVSGESQVQISSDSPLGTDIAAGQVFEIDDFSFDIEQVVTIGSSTSGGGGGKVTLNPFQITKKTDRASPVFLTVCCSGQHFKQVTLYIRKAGGGSGGVAGSQGQASTSGTTFLRFDFALVLIKTISWSGSDGDDNPKEEVQFCYGAIKAQYVQQDATGKPVTTATGKTMGSWNQVWNNSKYDTYLADQTPT